MNGVLNKPEFPLRTFTLRFQRELTANATILISANFVAVMLY